MATELQAQAEVAEWLATIPGVSKPNPWGNQCTALVQAYAGTLFGVPWQDSLGYGDAVDHLDNASRAYFDVIENDPEDPDLLPRRGDIAVYWGAAPLWDGRYYGHTGVVDSYTPATQTLLQQDGVAPPLVKYPDGYWYSAKPAHRDTFAYVADARVGNVRGWLRPKASRVVYTGADTRGYGQVAAPVKGDPWFPGAKRDLQPGGVELDTSLPPRVTWHITSDVSPGYVQPSLEAVWRYLKDPDGNGVADTGGYCPHIIWDPFTGECRQAFPATVGARALSRWNEDGAVHVQVEVLFSEGALRNGKRYDRLEDTPLKGFAELLGWLDSLGIPRVWPMGEPQPLHTNSTRDVAVWNSYGGHYGHGQVPGNDHTDPGIFPSITKVTTLGSVSSPVQTFMELVEGMTVAEFTQAFKAALEDKDVQFLLGRAVADALKRPDARERLAGAVWDAELVLEGTYKGTKTTPRRTLSWFNHERDRDRSTFKATLGTLADAVRPSRLGLATWAYRGQGEPLDAYGRQGEALRLLRQLTTALGLSAENKTGSTVLPTDKVGD